MSGTSVGARKGWETRRKNQKTPYAQAKKRYQEADRAIREYIAKTPRYLGKKEYTRLYRRKERAEHLWLMQSNPEQESAYWQRRKKR